MMTALIYLGVSLFILVTLVVLFRVEDSYGDRIIFSRIRTAGDRFLAAGKAQQGVVAHSGGVSYVRITWHYLVHTLLRRLLNLVRRVQSRLESAMQKNKAVARELQGNSSDSHLSAIAEHKEKVALSEEERQRRKAH